MMVSAYLSCQPHSLSHYEALFDCRVKDFASQESPDKISYSLIPAVLPLRLQSHDMVRGFPDDDFRAIIIDEMVSLASCKIMLSVLIYYSQIPAHYRCRVPQPF